MQSQSVYVASLANNSNWTNQFSSFPSRLRHRHRYHHHPHHTIKPSTSVTVSAPFKSRNHSKYICSLTLTLSPTLHPTTTTTTRSNCTNEEKERRPSPTNNNNNNKSHSHSHHHHHQPPCPQFHLSVEAHTHSGPDPEEENQFFTKTTPGFFSNMWWAELKAAVGQRINLEGIVSSAGTFFRDRHLALPHVAVPDVRYIDWAELCGRGFKGVVFDKDNTITVPYSLALWSPLGSSIDQCKSVFGNNVAVFSNSAGLYEYDRDGSKARALEKAIGIRVIRHGVKKPAGTAEEIEKHFGCKSSQLVMVGDRPFTDIVFGNRNGFFTILTEPLSLAEEPFIVRQVRKLEMSLVNYWFGIGLKPISHCLLPDVRRCVKDLPTILRWIVPKERLEIELFTDWHLFSYN